MDANTDVIEGKWSEFRGTVKERWGKLTDRELDRVSGRTEEIIGLLQQKYGYSRDRASEELNNLVDVYQQQMMQMQSALRGTRDRLAAKPMASVSLVAGLVMVVVAIYLMMQREPEL